MSHPGLLSSADYQNMALILQHVVQSSSVEIVYGHVIILSWSYSVLTHGITVLFEFRKTTKFGVADGIDLESVEIPQFVLADEICSRKFAQWESSRRWLVKNEKICEKKALIESHRRCVSQKAWSLGIAKDVGNGVFQDIAAFFKKTMEADKKNGS